MVTIVDYGSGNLRSVQKAFERIGASAVISDDPEAVARADRLVLPGVGAFADAMRELRTRGLIEPILGHIAADKPFFGICMGLQLLFSTGHEGGPVAGLGVLQGEVVRFSLPTGMKIPHMGWNTVQAPQDSVLFEDVADERFYFVHSYAARRWVLDASNPHMAEPMVTWAHHGENFVAAVENGPLSATQFHPEKSGDAGAAVLRSWVRSIAA